MIGAGGHRHALVRRRRAAPGGVRVLLLHGLAGSPTVWEEFTRRAGAGVEVWEAVLPWGTEGDPVWSRDDDPADQVTRALDRVPGGADAIVAHSFAAGPALEALVRRPEEHRPGAAVVVAPFYRAAPEDFRWQDAERYLNGFHRILEEGLRIAVGDRISPELRAAMALRVRDRIGPYGWQQFFGAYLRSPRLEVAALRLPVLVVAGADDIAAPPDDARALAAALPDGRLRLLAGCGHFAMAERPGPFADAVRALLAEALPGARAALAATHQFTPTHRS
ncbi:alpha/beta hydrolase [Streptomyces sp. NPDC093252]|uniref:alpha/beta fold hydrolase n=1 Tax=Streptomyces sp. NPDC093252 TaxID=3154980 RepID=UPI00342EBA42